MKAAGAELRVRRMTAADLDRVMEIAKSRKDAPRWPREVYVAAVNPVGVPRRIALVAVEITASDEKEEYPSEAKAPDDSGGVDAGTKVPAYRFSTRSPVAIGFAVAGVIAPEAELETIAVAVEGQRRGVASRLIAVLAEELRRAGVVDFHLEVRESNQPALGLYAALGFEETGRRPRYYVDPVEDALLLRMRVADSGPEFHSH